MLEFIEEPQPEFTWVDPNHPVLLEEYDGITVARDDICTESFYGSKTRFIDAMIRESSANEWVFGGSNNHGWGPISLACVCAKYGKKATVFMAERNLDNLTPTQLLTLKLGAEIRWVKMGMLPVTLARAREYHAADPVNRATVPLGLEHPTVVASIVKIARSLLSSPPTEIWTVGSSGTLNRGLQAAFPGVPAFIVQIGHELSPRERGRAQVFVSPLKWNQKVKLKDRPPFPSAEYYDAKAWTFVKQHAKPGALFWNCAPNLD